MDLSEVSWCVMNLDEKKITIISNSWDKDILINLVLTTAILEALEILPMAKIVCISKSHFLYIL